MRNAPMPWNKISASIRLIMAMFRLYAGIEGSWGKTVKDILKKQYPDAKDEIDKVMTDQALGQKMLAIAMKQTQYNEDKAQDAIQSQLMYWTTGTQSTLYSEPERKARYEKALAEYEDAKAKNKLKKGQKKPEAPETPVPYDFKEGGNETWRKALDNMFSNIRTKAMSSSMGYTKKEKQERSIDQAYGVRGEDGGAKDGGEGRMPTPEAPSGGVQGLGNLGQALDDKAGVLEFIQLIDDSLPDLKKFLNQRDPDQLKLFELVFDDDVGSFGSDVQENMKQATAMKEKWPELYQKNQKRWSGFIGDLRKKVLAGIWEFVEKHLTPGEYEALYDAFFSDTTPREMDKAEKAQGGEKLDYQRGLDERKLSKWKWQDQQGTLSDKDKAAMATLKSNMTKRYKDDDGVDFDAIPAMENPAAKDWKLYSKKTEKKTASYSLDAVASRVARGFIRHTGV